MARAEYRFDDGGERERRRREERDVLAVRRAKNREQQKGEQWAHRLTAVVCQQLTEGKMEWRAGCFLSEYLTKTHL